MIRQIRFGVLLFLLLWVPIAAKAVPQSTEGKTARKAFSASVPQSCSVTQPPVQAFVPPPPYPSEHDSTDFWFGSDNLWVQLPTNGTWNHLPHYRPTDTAFRQKIQWWRKDYDWRRENPPKLTMTGRRLDAVAPKLASDDHANAGGIGDHAFIMSGVDIPTLGCWQITGDYNGDKLTFVIWVAS
jgi:hypothetical protein